MYKSPLKKKTFRLIHLFRVTTSSHRGKERRVWASSYFLKKTIQVYGEFPSLKKGGLSWTSPQKKLFDTPLTTYTLVLNVSIIYSMQFSLFRNNLYFFVIFNPFFQ